jgi:integrase/recombinase XerC
MMGGLWCAGRCYAARRIDSAAHEPHRSYVGFSEGSDQSGPDVVLPTDMLEALDAFSTHLTAELGRSEHTVRAYVGDVTRLLTFTRQQGATSLEDLDLADLRGWLADEDASGHSRPTIARRAASARVFTAWAFRRGLIPADPGDRLATPTSRRRVARLSS